MVLNQIKKLEILIVIILIQIIHNNNNKDKEDFNNKLVKYHNSYQLKKKEQVLKINSLFNLKS